MKMIYAPDWLLAALQARALAPSDLKSVDVLLGTVSPEDVAIYIHLNVYNSAQVLPADIAASLPVVDLESQLKDAEPGSPKATVARLLKEYSLNKNAPKMDLEGKQLSCDLMDEDTIRFTHIPLTREEPSDASLPGLLGLYDRMIRQLYSFMPFHELCQKPLFRGYLTAAQARLSPNYVA